MRFKVFMRMLAISVLASLVVNGLSYAVNPLTIEQDWTPDFYQGYGSAASSTHSVTGIGTSFAILVVGSTAAYTVHYATRTYTPPTVAPAISSTVVHIVPDGRPVNHEFRAIAFNPSIVTHGMATGATVYVWIEYLRRKVN